MGQKNRTLIVILIAAVIAFAILASFGLYFLPGQTPKVVLPDSSNSDNPSYSQTPVTPDSGQYLPVEVTVDTVQEVISTLHRSDSYTREIQIQDIWGQDSSGLTTINVWVDDNFTRTQAQLPSNRVQNTLIDGDTLYLWYDQSQRYLTLAADETSSDLVQRFPSYEDILALDPEQIVDARYTDFSEELSRCIYVEVQEATLDYLYRYWVDIDSGLLVAAETEADGLVVYRMSSSSLQSPCPAMASFQLPDGTVLHQAD